jgi:hypothetical protein
MKNKSFDRKETFERTTTLHDTDPDAHSVNRRIATRLHDKEDISMKAQIAQVAQSMD